MALGYQDYELRTNIFLASINAKESSLYSRGGNLPYILHMNVSRPRIALAFSIVPVVGLAEFFSPLAGYNLMERKATARLVLSSPIEAARRAYHGTHTPKWTGLRLELWALMYGLDYAVTYLSDALLTPVAEAVFGNNLRSRPNVNRFLYVARETASSALYCPFYVVNNRMITHSNSSSTPRYTGLLDGLSSLYREGNSMSGRLFRGLPISIAARLLSSYLHEKLEDFLALPDFYANLARIGDLAYGSHDWGRAILDLLHPGRTAVAVASPMLEDYLVMAFLYPLTQVRFRLRVDETPNYDGLSGVVACVKDIYAEGGGEVTSGVLSFYRGFWQYTFESFLPISLLGLVWGLDSAAVAVEGYMARSVPPFNSA